MKKLLSLVALAGLIGGAFYTLAPKAEAASATQSQGEDPCGDNPYSEENFVPPPYPPRPTCPEGEILDRVCASIVEGMFDVACVAAACVASDAYDAACATLSNTACNHPQCHIDALIIFDAAMTQAATDFDTGTAAATVIYNFEMLKCCNWHGDN